MSKASSLAAANEIRSHPPFWINIQAKTFPDEYLNGIFTVYQQELKEFAAAGATCAHQALDKTVSSS